MRYWFSIFWIWHTFFFKVTIIYTFTKGEANILTHKWIINSNNHSYIHLHVHRLFSKGYSRKSQHFFSLWERYRVILKIKEKYCILQYTLLNYLDFVFIKRRYYIKNLFLKSLIAMILTKIIRCSSPCAVRVK